ncbi:MAG: mechanosensitive ion channel family protein [Asgard group archaeon]|nr:mechanosensitive ion channel family protein [Asgard group archaeon]
MSIFSLVVILFFFSYFKVNNFIENAFNNAFPQEGIENPYHLFLQTYILSLIIYVIIGVVLIWLWRLLIRAIKAKVSPSILNTLKILGDIIIIPFVAIAYLNKFEALSGTLIGVAAIVGTAIGFASTTTVGNLIAGLYLIVSRPFQITDYIIIPDMSTEGVVREMGINYTKVDQPDGNTAILPNSGLLNKWIYNTKIVKSVNDNDKKNSYFHKIKKKVSIVYSYPLKWACFSDDSHKECVKAIEITSNQFETKLLESVTWFIVTRDRFHRTYQMNLTVDDSYQLIDLTGEFMNALEANYEEIKIKDSVTNV